jgi:uncharacterized protein
MKAAMLQLIEAWQQNTNRKRGMCLQTPTCSAYGHYAISRYGVIRGGIMTAWRIFKCNGCMSDNTAAKSQPNLTGR